jgi:2-C-methyl-D-erythritol 4-phosphate cytidylyltransferase
VTGIETAVPGVVALVPAAGLGTRLGEPTPKAFVDLGGRSLLELAIEGLHASGVIDQVVVIVARDRVPEVRSSLPADVLVVEGGRERVDSVRAGLAAVSGARYVLVHDAARPLTPPAMIARVVDELRGGHVAVIPVLPVADTVKVVDADGVVTATPDRSSLRAAQTPQGFAASVLLRAYSAAGPELFATDDAALVERLGEPVRTIEGDRMAFKITNPLDLVVARALLADQRERL